MKILFTALPYTEGGTLPHPKNRRNFRISRDLQRHCARTCSLSNSLMPDKKRMNRRLDFPGGIGNKPGPYGKNHIRKRLDKISILTKKFPDYPFEPVSLNSLPYSVNTYTQPVACDTVRHGDQTEVLTTHPFPLVVNQPVLPWFDQQHSLGKSLGFHVARTVFFVRPGTKRSAACGPSPDDG